MGQQWLAAEVGTQYSSVCMGPLNEVYIIFITSTTVWPQVKNRKGTQTHSSTENWTIDLLSMALPISDQCKETEENNRMGQTRHLFRKIRYTKGTFHAKMGTIKDRNGTDVT